MKRKIRWLTGLAALQAALTLPASAELSQAKFDASRAAITAYAQQMTEFLPCAVLMFAGAPKDASVIADEDHGETAVRKVIAGFIARENGSRADEHALLLAWFENARPQYVQDIRALARFCEEKNFLIEAAQFRGAAVTLDRRPPFRKD